MKERKMQKTKNRNRKLIEMDAEFIKHNPNTEELPWELYDTQTIKRNEVVSKYKEFAFFVQPISSTKSESETNLTLAGTLSSPLVFIPSYFNVEVLPPFHQYVKDAVESNWVINFWKCSKIYTNGTRKQQDMYKVPNIIAGEHFGLRISFNEDFMLMEDIRIRASINGILKRGIQ